MAAKSELFEEFIMRRCEEISNEDEECQKCNEAILKIETEIKGLIPKEILLKFEEYEKLNTDLLAHSHMLFYKKAIEDIFSFYK